VAAEDLHLEYLNVKTVFLHDDLKEDIYMIQLQSYIMPKKEQLVCKLKKRLYGLKQAPRQWYLKFDRFIVSSGFIRLELITLAILSDLRSSTSYYYYI